VSIALTDTELVAYCGLYCGTCGACKNGRCKACKGEGGFASCPVRLCCKEKGIATCAECREFEDLRKCGKINSFISKFFALIFRSNRLGRLDEIRQKGLEAYAASCSSAAKK